MRTNLISTEYSVPEYLMLQGQRPAKIHMVCIHQGLAPLSNTTVEKQCNPITIDSILRTVPFQPLGQVTRIFD